MSELTLSSGSMQEQGKHILVVEDDSGLRFALALWLRDLQYNVTEAASAHEAIELLISPLAIDFIITDVQMPGSMNGFDLRHYVIKAFPNIHVVVVSGDDFHPQLKEESIFFFKKPYDLEMIALHVANTLNHAMN